MKKVIFLSLLCFFMTTGCGAGVTETMSCSYLNTVNNLTTKIKYDIDYEDKEVKKVRITYDYKQENTDVEQRDGVGTGTDGTTSDTQIDDDGIVDGIVGSAIDTIINEVTDTILDVAGLKERHSVVQDRYGSIQGFSVLNATDVDNNYKVTYVIDFDTISDDDLNRLNLSRDIDSLRDNYTSLGYSCDR